MAILFVAAEAMELKPFANALTALRKLKWPVDYAMEGILEGRRVVLAANGAGPKLAAQVVEVALRAVTAAELSASRLEAVVSTGFCGSLDRNLRESQIVLGTSIVSSEGDRGEGCEMISASPEGFVTGAILSVDRVLGTVGEKQTLGENGLIAVDMEAAGVLARTRRAGLPFYCIKVVSDRADESFTFDLNRMRTSEGRISRGKIVTYALGHPGALPQVLRLKRRAENAARALGDFLVNCRILPESDSALPE
jgi:nucleoside phosphorylase